MAVLCFWTGPDNRPQRVNKHVVAQSGFRGNKKALPVIMADHLICDKSTSLILEDETKPQDESSDRSKSVLKNQQLYFGTLSSRPPKGFI